MWAEQRSSHRSVLARRRHPPGRTDPGGMTPHRSGRPIDSRATTGRSTRTNPARHRGPARSEPYRHFNLPRSTNPIQISFYGEVDQRQAQATHIIGGRHRRKVSLTDIDSHPAITVLEVAAPPDGTTRYVDQVVTTASPSTKFRYFTWRNAFLSHYDVLHVHWPENLIRHASRIRRGIQPLALMLLLVALRLRRIPIVRTLHNLAPHEQGSPLERLALRALDRSTRVFVTINPVTRAPRGIEVSIPHGHYRARFEQHARRDTAAGTLTYAGLIRPYKGIERLIKAFESLPIGLVDNLRIVGKPTPELRAHIENVCARDPRISARLAFVPDADLVAELTQAELVCLPYDEMHNSGMALVGLSMDRPILAPSTPTTRALSDEVGSGWMYLFDGPLDATKLAAAINQQRVDTSTRSPRPVLEDRDWQLVSERYETAFRIAIRGKKEA